MHGQERLLEMRLKGVVPDWVWIDMNTANAIDQARDWLDMNNARAHIQLDIGDRVSRLDMRFVRGLPVWVEGEVISAVHELRDKCIAMGASRVISSVMERHGRGEMVAYRCTDMTDTQGVFVNPETEYA